MKSITKKAPVEEPKNPADLNAQKERIFYNRKITIKKLIKYLLPYGIVRQIQKRRINRKTKKEHE